MTEGNTLLDEEEMEKLTLLKMNKEFMKFMRKHYNHLTKQQIHANGCLTVRGRV